MSESKGINPSMTVEETSAEIHEDSDISPETLKKSNEIGKGAVSVMTGQRMLTSGGFDLYSDRTHTDEDGFRSEVKGTYRQSDGVWASELTITDPVGEELRTFRAAIDGDPGNTVYVRNAGLRDSHTGFDCIDVADEGVIIHQTSDGTPNNVWVSDEDIDVKRNGVLETLTGQDAKDIRLEIYGSVIDALKRSTMQDIRVLTDSLLG